MGCLKNIIIGWMFFWIWYFAQNPLPNECRQEGRARTGARPEWVRHPRQFHNSLKHAGFIVQDRKNWHILLNGHLFWVNMNVNMFSMTVPVGSKALLPNEQHKNKSSEFFDNKLTLGFDKSLLLICCCFSHQSEDAVRAIHLKIAEQKNSKIWHTALTPWRNKLLTN